MHHLVAAHRQGAVVRLAGDVEVDTDEEGVAGSQHAVGQVPLETVEGWWGEEGARLLLKVPARGLPRVDATPTVVVGSVVQLDGSRAVLQHPVGFFLSAGLQRDALALAADASLDLVGQPQRRHEKAQGSLHSHGQMQQLEVAAAWKWSRV